MPSLQICHINSQTKFPQLKSQKVMQISQKFHQTSMYLHIIIIISYFHFPSTPQTPTANKISRETAKIPK